MHCLVKDCVLQPIPWKGKGDDPRVHVATLPEGQSWFALKSDVLFVRSCYDPLWDKLDRLYKAFQVPGARQPTWRLLLLGTPGIGKTVLMNYFLHRALNTGYKVMFETQERRFYFHDGVVESELLETHALSNFRHDSTVFFLVDPQQKKPPPFVEAFTVAAILPDEENYKEFAKNLCTLRWMPLPSAAEVVAMNSVDPQLPLEELQSRLEHYGPIPRRGFSRDQEQTQSVLRAQFFRLPGGAHQGAVEGRFQSEQLWGLSWMALRLATEGFRSVCDCVGLAFCDAGGNGSALCTQALQAGAYHRHRTEKPSSTAPCRWRDPVLGVPHARCWQQMGRVCSQV